MRSVLIALALLGVSTAANAQKAGGVAPVTINATLTGDINKFVDQLVAMWNAGFARLTDRKGTVLDLSLELSRLAGTHEALALSLEQIVKNPSLARADFPGAEQHLDRLQDQVSEIETSMARLRAVVRKLDPNWGIKNVNLTADVGGFAADGMVFYRTSGGDLVALTNLNNTAKLARELRQDSAKLRALSQSVASSI